MSRLGRFESYRYIGTKDTMRFYDCDDEAQFTTLSDRLVEDDLLENRLLQVFAPDTPTEARNRSYSPAI
jgi:hypothetical protein